MTEHQKDNVFMFTIMLGKLLGGCKGTFFAKIGPQIRFFTLYPQNPPFLGFDRPDSMGSLVPHILR